MRYLTSIYILFVFTISSVSAMDSAELNMIIEKVLANRDKRIAKEWAERRDTIDSGPISSGRECHSRLAGKGTTPRGVCVDMVSNSWRGPQMVVIPSGNGIEADFALSKYEISIKDWTMYCVLSKTCNPESNRARDNEPARNLSIEEIHKYLAWLSERTGKTYRLPTRTEWEYAAMSDGRQAGCYLFSNEKIEMEGNLYLLNSGVSNKWGLLDQLGGVLEWVTENDNFYAIGGSYEDDNSKCVISLSIPYSVKRDDITGFRVLLELE